MKKILIIFLCLLTFSSVRMKAGEFFDTSEATTFFSLSGRIGFNTSVKTFPANHFTVWNHNSWGTGFNIGAIANLNFREYLTVQPGLFFSTGSGAYSYVTDYLNMIGGQDRFFQMGKTRNYYLRIPIMGVVNFNLAENIKWMVEFGPYFQIRLKETGYKNITVLYRLPQNTKYDTYVPSTNGFDFGFKMGSGLRFYSHYYVGVHYLAGVCNAWTNPSGGKNKSWEFSVGYDF